MTTRFRVYGKPENQADGCDDVIETLGDEVAEMVHEFSDFAEEVKATAIDIRGELKHLRDGLNMLEAAGNHNTKIASEEFKKIETAFERGHERIAKLESSPFLPFSVSVADARIAKLERTALTRDEVADFVASTRERLGKIESVSLRESQIHTAIADTYTAVKDLKQRLDNQNNVNNHLQKQISELVAQVSRRRIGGYGTTGF